MDKSCFLEWSSTVLTLVNDKINLLKNKINTKKVKSVFKDHEVKENVAHLKECFDIVPIDKVTNNVAFICKQFYVKVLVDELNFPNANNHNNTTYLHVHDSNKQQIIQEHKTYLKQLKIELEHSMESLHCMY